MTDAVKDLEFFQQVRFLCIHKMRRVVRWERRQPSMDEVLDFVKKSMMKYVGVDTQTEFIKKQIRVLFATGDLKYPYSNIWGINPVPPGFEELGE